MSHSCICVLKEHRCRLLPCSLDLFIVYLQKALGTKNTGKRSVFDFDLNGNVVLKGI